MLVVLPTPQHGIAADAMPTKAVFLRRKEQLYQQKDVGVVSACLAAYRAFRARLPERKSTQKYDLCKSCTTRACGTHTIRSLARGGLRRI